MTRLLHGAFLAGLFSIAAATASLRAGAQTADEASTEDKASELKKRGNEAMEKGRPADALAMYRAAYEAAPNAALLYNMGRAHQALADYPQALRYLTRFEQEADSDLKRRVPNLSSLVEEVRARVATVTIKANVVGAIVRLGDKRLGSTPLEGPVQVNAGTVMLEVTSDGYLPYEETVRVEGGKSTTLEVKLDSKETHGVLEVRSPEPQVRVLIDGKLRGMVPLELRLPAGQHRLELRKDGFDTVSTSAVVQAGKRREVTIQIEEEPALYERWWFWTGIGLVAAGTVTAIVINGKEQEADVGTIPPGQISGALSF